MAGLHHGSREPAGGHSTSGGLAGHVGGSSFVPGGAAGRCATVCDPGSPSGIGLEAGETPHVRERGRPMGRMDGGRPMVIYTNLTKQGINEEGEFEPRGDHQGVEGEDPEVHQVLDQGDDGEFEVLNEEDKMVLLQRYVNSTGTMPEEEEEPTIEQLSALKKKIALGKPPYCDFGVFVPFGRKALRASKYRTWIPTAEGYVSKELPGPANFTQWRACYRVFTTAMLMLQECALAPLHAYELYVEKLTRLYPDAWHLVYSADEMARSELLSRLRIKINLDQKEGRPIPPLFDERKPWETVFKMIPGELRPSDVRPRSEALGRQ